MSTVVLMRLLESAPDRYDAGMRWLSLGAVPRLHEAAAEAAVVRPRERVLEIGCGTGALTKALLARGAEVVAIDHDPEMLARARKRLAPGDATRLELRELTAAEIDTFDSGAFDAVVASLSLSEMSAHERAYVLKEATRVLRPAGRVVIADEVRPRARWQRVIHAIVRYPLALATWLVAGATTRAITDAGAELRAAGLAVTEDRRHALGTLAVVVGEKTR